MLTHTGGFRWVTHRPLTQSWDEIIVADLQGQARRDWVPGQKAGYHPYSSWYILAELIQRVDGRPFPDYVREEIFQPLGMRDSYIGPPPATSNDSKNVWASCGTPIRTRRKYTATIRPRRRTSWCPAATCAGPMHDLGRFYQMLLDGGAASRRPSALTRRSRSESTVDDLDSASGMYDETFKHMMNWSLGLIMNSKDRRGHRPLWLRAICFTAGPPVRAHNPRFTGFPAYGHGGSQCSVGFADPERKLVVCVVFNGMPGEAQHDRRLRQFLAALYTDLGFAE